MNNKKRIVVFTVLLAAVLAGANMMLYRHLLEKRYKWIVIHHTASHRDNLESIRAYHKKQYGWRDAAYHVVLSNGSTTVPSGYIEPTKRYESFSYSLATGRVKYNVWGIHLCVVGNYEQNSLPRDLQIPLGFAVAYLQKKFDIPDQNILFHRDVGRTLCPGKNISKKEVFRWKENAETCPKDIRLQQENALNSGGFTLQSLPGIFLLCFVSVNGLILIVFSVIVKKNISAYNNSLAEDLPDQELE